MALSPGDTFTRGDYNYTVDYVDNSYAYLAATVADKTKSSYANLSSFTYSGMNCIVDSMNNCYAGCENLTNPPTVPSTIFGMNGCFEGCTALTSAPSIPSGVVDMSNAFKGCSSLTSVPNIPERTYESTHGYNYDFLMGSCFEGCTSLVTAPTINVSSCTVYMAQCYWGCTSIRTVSSLPKVSHMAYCFANCSSLVSAPSIPSTVFNMEYCFSRCSALASSPSIPSSVNFIEGLFDGCSSLSSAPALPNVLNLNRCFRGCTSLTSAPTIPSSVTKMDECFRGCTSLATASTIPSSVDSMLDTFYGCSALAGNIVIHSDGANITNTLFYGTVEDIYLVTDTAPFWKYVANQYSNVHLRCASATSQPTLSATSKRTENGSTGEAELGEYAYITVTPTLDTEDWYGNEATVALSVDGTAESVTWYDSNGTSVNSMQTGQTYHTWVDTGDLLSHTLSFSATDSTEHISSVVNITFAQAFALMSFKAGGTGAAIGTYATEDDFTVALPTNFVGDDTDNPTGINVRGQAMLPAFYYTTKPAESDLPITPCIVIQTSDWSIWYADGTDYHQLNDMVLKTGDTMSGPLRINGSDLQLGTANSSSNDTADMVWYYGNGNEKARIWFNNTYTATGGPNYRIYKSDGTQLYSGTLLPCSGGTLAGTLNIKSSNIDRDGSNPSSNTYGTRFFAVDKDGEAIGYTEVLRYTDGRQCFGIVATNEKTDGTAVYNVIYAIVARDGTQTYTVSNPANFRSAIGAVNKAGDTMTGRLAINVNGVKSWFGSANSGWVHYLNDQGKSNYFAQQVHVDGDIYRYGGSVYWDSGSCCGSYGEARIYRLVYAGSYAEASTSNHGTYGISWWSSDARMKDGIADSEVDALPIVNAIQHRQFTMDGEFHDIGYVAQELEEIDPQLALKIPCNRQIDDKNVVFTGDYRYQVDERKVIPYLSKAIQELSDKVDELEARVAELEGK